MTVDYTMNKGHIHTQIAKNYAICLGGMSEKDLFHRPGTYVVKNDFVNCISIEQKIKDIESQIHY